MGRGAEVDRGTNSGTLGIARESLLGKAHLPGGLAIASSEVRAYTSPGDGICPVPAHGSECDSGPRCYPFCERGIGSRPWRSHASGSRMALHIFPDGCLRQGIKADSIALAVESYRREFLLTKHGDDPMQRNTARPPDKFMVHESSGGIFVGHRGR